MDKALPGSFSFFALCAVYTGLRGYHQIKGEYQLNQQEYQLKGKLFFQLPQKLLCLLSLLHEDRGSRDLDVVD